MTRWAPFLALMLAACATGRAAPISYGSGAPQPARGAAPAIAEAPAPARERPETPPPDWAEGDGPALSAYALQPEDVQPYDPARTPRTHRVGADESLYDIATAYQIPLRALIDQNRLEPPYALAPGRVIDLPPPRIHRVARGERLEDVARRYNVDTRSLALMNRLQPPYAVREGEAIVLPALARAHAEPQAPTPAATATPAQAGGASARFSWPLRGEVLARYGVQGDGRRLDGVEIAAGEGAPISAAGDGEVVYAGDDLPAYGVLVLVRHPDNYMTAYGYARRALVQTGQSVRAGEPIAEVGRTDGRSRLLFQVRRGTEAVDPLPLLRN